jgi:chromosome partitioning protein
MPVELQSKPTNRATAEQPMTKTKQKIITVISNSGGAGKSTLCRNMAYELGMKGLSVLAIDLDPQHNLDLFFGLTQYKAQGTITDVFSEDFQGSWPIAEIPDEKTHLIRGSDQMQKVQQQIVTRFRQEEILKSQLEEYPLDYDVIFLDCPATSGGFVYNAIACATHLLIPVVPEEKSIQGLNGLFSTIATIGKELKLNPKPSILGIVPMAYDEASQTHRDAIAVLEQRCKLRSIDLLPPIKLYQSIKKANGVGLPMGKYRPAHKGSAELKALAKNIYGKINGN